jgi:hypothetical protein
MERRERLLADLQKMQRRVDEFADYGELSMMAEYAQDVKQVQKKIVEVENEIEWINQVSHRKNLFLFYSILFLGRNTISNGEN